MRTKKAFSVRASAHFFFARGGPFARALALCLLLSLVLLSGGCGSILAESALHPKSDPKRAAMLKEVRAQVQVGWTGYFREFSYAAQDGTPLRAVILLPPDSAKPRGVVVLVHGLYDQKEGMLRYAEGFAERGYVAVCPDLRAHGQSGGRFTSFGGNEKHDMVALLDALQHTGYDTRRVGAVGASMGAATALQWAGIDARVKAVVAVAPFADLESEAMYLYRKSHFKFSTGQIAYLKRAAQHVGHFLMKDVSPLLAVRSIDTPIYLVHGQRDALIPPSDSDRLFHAARGPVVVEWVPDAGHRSVVTHAGAGMLERAFQWIDAFVPADSGPPIAPAWAAEYDHRNMQIAKAETPKAG